MTWVSATGLDEDDPDKEEIAKGLLEGSEVRVTQKGPDGSITAALAFGEAHIPSESIFSSRAAAVEAAKLAAQWKAIAAFAQWLTVSVSEKVSESGGSAKTIGLRASERVQFLEPVHFETDNDQDVVFAILRWRPTNRPGLLPPMQVEYLRRSLTRAAWRHRDEQIWLNDVLVYESQRVADEKNRMRREKVFQIDGSVVYELVTDGSVQGGPVNWGSSRAQDGATVRRFPDH